MSEWPKKVEAWQTQDGKVLLDREEADKKQTRLEFDTWYGENPLTERYTSRSVGADDFFDWWDEHRLVLAEFAIRESDLHWFDVMLSNMRKSVEEKER